MHLCNQVCHLVLFIQQTAAIKLAVNNWGMHRSAAYKQSLQRLIGPQTLCHKLVDRKLQDYGKFKCSKRQIHSRIRCIAAQGASTLSPCRGAVILYSPAQFCLVDTVVRAGQDGDGFGRRCVM